MKIIQQSVTLLEHIDGEEILWRIEAACRNCYKSEGKNEERSKEKRDRLIRHVVERGHTSVLEHGVVSFRVVTNRGVSHEWVRHRIGWSYSQESTRYVNYGHGADGITVIWPWYLGEPMRNLWEGDTETHFPYIQGKYEAYDWYRFMQAAEKTYLELLKRGCNPEEARGVLPNDTKTEIVCTANIVALRHFFMKRCHKTAHPQIRELALSLLDQLHAKIPVVFDDIYDMMIGNGSHELAP